MLTPPLTDFKNDVGGACDNTYGGKGQGNSNCGVQIDLINNMVIVIWIGINLV